MIADDSIVNITTIITCKICPNGFKCPYEGMINPIECPEGTYSPNAS